MRRYAALLAAVLALGLVAAACGNDDDTNTGASTPTPTPTVTPTSFGDASTFFLSAGDQSSDGTRIAIAQAIFTGQNGFVAIHSDAGGAPGPVIGVSSLLEAGTHDAITITLTTPLTASATVFPMLHTDSDKDRVYTFPGPDGPATAGGKVVVFPIKITVS
jgi:hypothetical protein